MKTYPFTAISSMLVLTLLVTGCGQSGQQAAPAVKTSVDSVDTFTKEPVKLTVVNHGAGINTETDLENVILKPVRTMYPNITIELVKGKSLNDLIAAGDTPDLVVTSNFYLDALIEMGLATDLNEFVKTYKIDLGRLEPETISALSRYGKKGELYGIPYSMNYGIMAYNKDIFDKFGVAYPKDGMNWDQVIDLAKKVTRKSDTTQYLGIDPGLPQVMTRPYSLSLMDAGQEKAALTTDAYKSIFSKLRSIYDIPGMIDPKTNYLKDNIDFFLKDQRVAMEPYWISALSSRVLPLAQSGQNFNWDLVSFPSYADRPGLGREVDFHLFMVTPAGKNKEAVYRVLQAMQSNEAQVMMNKGGRLTALKDPQIKKDYATDLKIFEGKNLAGVFSVKPAPAPVSSMYDSKIYTYLSEAMKSMILSSTDINTVLREAEEKANKYIEEEKQKKK
ncbi:extracellular solute-binding protein [Paenibacillus mesophilus]|uniref:ABC transporter substrate-binding protein n=1 Tax=Paenibacillus mesophilus TaxID=2582849 RepID=UPI00110EAB09|nr:extracellular solute-binding protein [Paenibacillus mesophilus]TMV43400.1 extracellular solute-binding protein [Paenibacillus mesophilus]